MKSVQNSMTNLCKYSVNKNISNIFYFKKTTINIAKLKHTQLGHISNPSLTPPILGKRGAFSGRQEDAEGEAGCFLRIHVATQKVQRVCRKSTSHQNLHPVHQNRQHHWMPGKNRSICSAAAGRGAGRQLVQPFTEGKINSWKFIRENW